MAQKGTGSFISVVIKNTYKEEQLQKRKQKHRSEKIYSKYLLERVIETLNIIPKYMILKKESNNKYSKSHDSPWQLGSPDSRYSLNHSSGTKFSWHPFYHDWLSEVCYTGSAPTEPFAPSAEVQRTGKERRPFSLHFPFPCPCFTNRKNPP